MLTRESVIVSNGRVAMCSAPPSLFDTYHVGKGRNNVSATLSLCIVTHQKRDATRSTRENDISKRAEHHQGTAEKETQHTRPKDRRGEERGGAKEGASGKEKGAYP